MFESLKRKVLNKLLLGRSRTGLRDLVRKNIQKRVEREWIIRYRRSTYGNVSG
jgi:hypothetical protein